MWACTHKYSVGSSSRAANKGRSMAQGVCRLHVSCVSRLIVGSLVRERAQLSLSTDVHLQQLSATFVAAADQCGRRNAALWLAVAEAPRIVPSPVPMRRSGTPLGANLGTAEGAHGPNSRVEQAGRPAVDLLAVPLAPARSIVLDSDNETVAPSR